MPSKTAAGAAPLITGILLAFQSAGAIIESGLSLWSVPGFVGGCAGIVIGLGILLEWNTLGQDPTEQKRASAALLGIATTAFFVGTAIAIA
ncbi:hypothetical protein [Halorubrum sp. N11]|uniref:hypothetical protein n=1 Tax=Halorubrum sp. N11 TaxID=3402276 RepID=UPI003EB8D86C